MEIDPTIRDQINATAVANLTNQLVNRPMISPTPSPPDSDFFKFRIGGLDILEEIEHQLKGEVWDKQEKKYVNKFDRWINDEGINKILHVIFACGINKNTFLGNLSNDQILFKCRMLKTKLALLLFKKYQAYEIKKEMRDLLITTVVNTVHSALSRSEGGLEARQLSTAAQRHDIYQHSPNQQKSGFIDKLPFVGRR